MKTKVQSKAKATAPKRTTTHRAAPRCALCAKFTEWKPALLRFADFRQAIRSGSIDALVAKRIFRKYYTRLKDICERENCSLNRARTINAMLEGDVNAALLCAGKPGILKAYTTVEDLIRELES
mgnify:CR=1 FL=1